MQSEGLRRKLVCLELDSKTAPAHGGDSVMQNSKVVGTITSAGKAHRLGSEVPAAICDMGLYDINYDLVRS